MIDYDQYEQWGEERPRRRKHKAHHRPKKTQREILQSIAEPTQTEGIFATTYTPGQFEEGWLLNSLRSFFDGALITDVLAKVKGGKEASVYHCAAHPTTQTEFLAAKVYRPHQMRQIRNDAIYREGRQVLGEDGKAVHKTSDRTLRAIHKKTEFGRQVMRTGWLAVEYNTLKALYWRGADVPQPYGCAENAILMSYCGDDSRPASTLSEVHLARRDAKRLFERVLHNIGLLLDEGLVHGDLSAFNILYWEGNITLIDFPQVVYITTNRNARALFGRDVQRVCDYFQRQGLDCDAQTIAADLWQTHVGHLIAPQPPETLDELAGE